MASATDHRPSNGSLNGSFNSSLNSRTRSKLHRHAPDNDSESIRTEQFPPFDPTHDGSISISTTSSSSSSDSTATGTNAGGDGRARAPLFSDDLGTGFTNGLVSASMLADDDDNNNSSPPNHHRLFSPSERDSSPELAYTHTAATTATAPPYWTHGNTTNNTNNGNGNRSAAYGGSTSTESLVHAGGITLQDNEALSDEAAAAAEARTSYGRDRNRACWAKSVEVTDYVIVNGSATNIGAFVVWNIRVETLSGPYMNIRKRYSEFDDFRRQLVRTFPSFEAAVPVLPPKSVISKFRPRFLEKRRAGLQYFLNCILLNPEFSGSPVLKDFLFS